MGEPFQEHLQSDARLQACQGGTEAEVDAEAEAQIFDRLRAMTAEQMVILISHRLDDIFYVCDRVMALYHGRNFAEGRLTDIERNEVVGWIMGNRGGEGIAAAVDHN